MPDTFVHFRGIKNDAFRDEPDAEFYSHSFVARHETPQQLKQAIHTAMGEMAAMQGMIVVKDVMKCALDSNNLVFIPMHRIARIEFHVQELIGVFPTDTEGVVKH